MAKIKPIGDKVLVERVESQEKTAGGIVLPDTAKEKPTEGRVVAVGDGKTTDEGKRLPLGVKPGDRVLFGSFAGTAIKDSGKEYLILEEGDLLGVIDDAPWAGGGSGKASGASKGGGKPAPTKRKR
jgi:chaperonin GroES